MIVSRKAGALHRAAATSAGVHLLALGALVVSAARPAPDLEPPSSLVEVTALAPLDEAAASAGRAANIDLQPNMELVSGAAPRTRLARGSRPGERPQLAAAAAFHPGGEPAAAARSSQPAARARLARVDVSSGEARNEGSALRAPEDLTASQLAPFLEELAREVRVAWHPSQVYLPARPEDPGAEARTVLAGAADVRATTLRVQLRADGSLGQLAVAESSGHAALDAEAMAALERAQPFSPPAHALLDPAGTLTFHLSLHLDLSDAAYLVRLGRQLSASWAPPPAVRRFEGFDRMTVVRARLAADGTVSEAAVAAPSGLDLLDASALGALRPGTRLPQPPSGLRRPGHADLHFTFLHRAREACEVTVARAPVATHFGP